MKQRKVEISALILVFVFGLILRLSAIGWGIPSADLPHIPLHPDEVWAMNVIQAVDFDQGDFNPEEGHREGTLAYLIWSGTAYCLKLTGLIEKLPHPSQAFDQDYANVLLAGRLVVVLFDLLCGILIFQTVKLATKDPRPALLSFLVFIITPFEVIHAHFMRTHIIANFFIALVMYLSFRLYNDSRLRSYFSTGLAVGLSFAARYPSLAVAAVPFIVHFFRIEVFRSLLNGNYRSIFRNSLSSQLPILSVGALLGAFVGLPFLFLDFESARPHLLTQATYIASNEFSLSELLNLERIWTYLRYLIPYGTLPALWILYYGSVLYLLTCRQLYRYFIPLLIFMSAYLYSMAKGYFALAVFIRAALPLFPPLAICVGLAYWSFSNELSSPIWRRTLQLCLAVIITCSICFDLAYVNGMKSDPRVQLARYLSSTTSKENLTIGYYSHPHNYMIIRPTLDVLQRPKVTYVERPTFKNNHKKLDFLLLSAFEYQTYARLREVKLWLKNSRKYELVRSFHSPISIFGVEFNYSRNPHDLLYPFPTLELWRPIKAKRKVN